MRADHRSLGPETAHAQRVWSTLRAPSPVEAGAAPPPLRVQDMLTVSAGSVLRVSTNQFSYELDLTLPGDNNTTGGRANSPKCKV